MSFRYASFVLFFLGTLSVAACSGDDSAALPLPDAGPTPTTDAGAHEGGAVDAGAVSDAGAPGDGAADAATVTDAADLG